MKISDRCTIDELGTETTVKELKSFIGRTLNYIHIEGYGYSFSTNYFRANSPVIVDADKLPNGQMYFQIHGSGIVYFSKGRVVVWK